MATSSMKTPAVLIVAISLTPKAFTTVVNRINTVARITALVATSYFPVPSPTIWNTSEICGNVSW